MLNIEIHVFSYRGPSEYWSHYTPDPNIAGFSKWAFPNNDQQNTAVLYHHKGNHFEVIVPRSDAVHVQEGHVAVNHHSDQGPMSSGPSEATSESPNGVGMMGQEESNVGKQDQGRPSAQSCAQVDDVEGAYSGQCESRSSNEREGLPAGEEGLGAQHESVNDSRPSSRR